MGSSTEELQGVNAQADTGRLLAAIDLGSNSFHLIVARLDGPDLHIVDRIKETVRLRSGLSDEGDLDPEARSRALACLARFGERLRGMGSGQVRAVGTDALRRASDSRDFLEAAEQALGHPIDIISGFEEARLIYAGANPDIQAGQGSRLVLDIGGGSTEVILGDGPRPKLLESLGVGSVSVSERFFNLRQIKQSDFAQALSAARGEFSGVSAAYRYKGWARALGASGTIRSVAALCEARGWSKNGVSAEGLKALCEEVIERGSLDQSDYPEIKADRVPILPGGLAVLRAAFDVLGIEFMEVAPGALREGLLDDMAGRIQNRDIRHDTVQAMVQRYRLDARQGLAVSETCANAWDAVAAPWSLEALPEGRDFIRWAGHLHEIGMAISHSQHHKHGGYILSQADMAGFSRDDQLFLSTLVRLQRKKLSRRHVHSLASRHRAACLPMACLLRVSIALHRTRGAGPELQFEADGPGHWRLLLPAGWESHHPLLRDDLMAEQDFQRAAGLSLEIP